MIIDKNVSLKNSFGINASSNISLTVNSEECIDDLKDFLANNSYKKLIIGEATNILLPKNFEGVVIKNNILNKNHEWYYLSKKTFKKSSD